MHSRAQSLAAVRRGVTGAFLSASLLASPARAQIVPAPSGEDLLRWSRECLHVEPDQWPVVDALQDTLIEALRKPPASKTAAYQAAKEAEFFDGLAAAIEAPDCITQLRHEREESRLLAVLFARRIRVRVANPTDVFGELVPSTEAGRALIDRAHAETILALRELEQETVDADLRTIMNLARANTLGPAEMKAALAVRSALEGLAGVVPPEQLVAARDRWESALSRRASEDSLRIVVILRHLRNATPEQDAQADRLADEVQSAVRSQRHDQVAALMGEAAPASAKAAQDPRDVWTDKVAAILGGERGESLESVCRDFDSALGFVDRLNSVVTPEGIAALSPWIRAPNLRGDRSVEERLGAIDAWESSALRTLADRLAPTAEEISRVRKIVSPTEPESIARFDAVVQNWREAYSPTSRVAAAVEQIRVWRSDTSHEIQLPRPVQEEIAEIGRERTVAERTAIDGLLELCAKGGSREEFDLWRLDRACAVGSIAFVPGTSTPARLTGLWSPALAQAVGEVANENAIIDARRLLAEASRELLDLAKELGETSVKEAQRACAEAEGKARAAVEFRDPSSGAVRLSEEFFARESELAEEAMRPYPPPKRSSEDVWASWCAARRRLLDRCAASLPPDVTAAIVHEWGCRSIPALARDHTLAEIRRLALRASASNEPDSHAQASVERAMALAMRLEPEVIDLHYRPTMDADAHYRRPQRLKELEEDRALALFRLRRDLGE